MIVEKGRNSAFTSIGSSLTTFLLWVFFFAAPWCLVRSAFVEHLDEDRNDRILTARRYCFSEMRKFTQDLRVGYYLENKLDLKSPEGISKNQTLSWLKNFKFPLSKAGLEDLRKTVHQRTGMKPALIMSMCENESECRGYLSPELRDKVDWKSLRVEMSKYFLQNRTLYYRYFFNIQPPGSDSIWVEGNSFLNRLLGLKKGFINLLLNIEERHSWYVNGRCYVTNIPVFSEGKREIHHFIQLGFIDRGAFIANILRRVSGNTGKFGFNRTFRVSANKSLPRFETHGKDMIFLEALPLGLLDILSKGSGWKALREKDLVPLLGIEVKSEVFEPLLQAWLPVFNLSFLLVGTIGYLLIRRCRAGDTPLKGSLTVKVSTAFILGVLLPLGGTFWIGSSYLASEKNLKIEETLDFMGMELEKIDRTIISFESLLSKRIEKFRKKTEQKLWKSTALTDFVIEAGKKGLVFGLYLFRNDDWEFLTTQASANSIADKLKELFRGPVLETMMNTGSFKEKSGNPGTMEKFQNLIALSFSLMEKNFDISFFSRLLGRPGCLFDNTVSTSFQQISSVFYRSPETHERNTPSLTRHGGTRNRGDNSPDAIGFAVLSPENRFRQYFSHLASRGSMLRRKINGFTVYFHIYRILTLGVETLTPSWYGTNFYPFQNDAYKRLILAESINTGRNNLRSNNLGSSQPHLVCSRVMGGRSMFGMGYAEPDPAASELVSPRIMAGTAIYGFLLVMLIARFTARLLTRPIQAFLEAMKSTRSGNFRWRIDWRENDEFGELASSFNRMAVGLLEKEEMSRMVSEDVLEAVSADDESGIKPGGQRVEATVLFSDIRGFTTLSEQHPPNVIVDMLNDYFTLMARCIKENDGVLDKFIGDAIQAVFYPKAEREQPSMRACRAAIAMRKALGDFNSQRNAEEKFPINTGIGLASGVLVAGCVGSSQGRLDYTVIGRTLQIAVRLEAESKKATKTGIMVEPVTIRNTRGAFRIEYLERIELESGTRTVPVYELLDIRT